MTSPVRTGQPFGVALRPQTPLLIARGYRFKVVGRLFASRRLFLPVLGLRRLYAIAVSAVSTPSASFHMERAQLQRLNTIRERMLAPRYVGAWMP